MSKHIRTIAQLIFVILLFLGGCRILDLMYVPEDEWHRILFHSYYTQNRNIDYAFVGSSHVLCDVEPDALDEINNGNNFNMSSPQQRYDASYYLLRQMGHDNSLKHVYLECYYLCVTDHEIYDEATDSIKVSDYIGDPDHFASSWQISYAMKPSVNAYAIRLLASDRDHTFENLFPFVRYREKLFDWDFISGNSGNFHSGDERGYSFHIDYQEPDGKQWCQEYHEKGDNYSTGRVYDSEKIFPADRDLTKYGIGNRSRYYIQKCIEYCQKNNIPVTLFVSPVLDFQLLSTGNYDNYVNELKQLADSYNVECYDFNLIKKEYLDIKHGDYYMDPEHLNTKGATLYTHALWDVLNDTPENNSKKFHASYFDKIHSEAPEIYGLYYRVSATDDSLREYTIASNREDMNYKVYVINTDEADNTRTMDEEIEVDRKTGTFTLPSDRHGTAGIETVYNGEKLNLEVAF
ncbi:MAG: hypothetical protein K6E53_12065 [Lachnospiraceae bacterium]|nr:hypothetical protein [Lachnospiraceae bacterium]